MKGFGKARGRAFIASILSPEEVSMTIVTNDCRVETSNVAAWETFDHRSCQGGGLCAASMQQTPRRCFAAKRRFMMAMI